MDENELLDIMRSIVAELEAADHNNFPSKIQNSIEPVAWLARNIWVALGRNHLYASSIPVWREVREVLSRAVRLRNPNEATLWWLESLRTNPENIAFLAHLATKEQYLDIRKTILNTLQGLIAQARAQNNDDYEALRLLVDLFLKDAVWERERETPPPWDMGRGSES